MAFLSLGDDSVSELLVSGLPLSPKMGNKYVHATILLHTRQASDVYGTEISVIHRADHFRDGCS